MRRTASRVRLRGRPVIGILGLVLAVGAGITLLPRSAPADTPLAVLSQGADLTPVPTPPSLLPTASLRVDTRADGGPGPNTPTCIETSPGSCGIPTDYHSGMQPYVSPSP